MQDILPAQLDELPALEIGIAVAHGRVGIDQFPMLVPDDLRKRISPQEKVNHGCLSKYERSHFRVG